MKFLSPKLDNNLTMQVEITRSDVPVDGMTSDVAFDVPPPPPREGRVTGSSTSINMLLQNTHFEVCFHASGVVRKRGVAMC